jgi:hypothetical protein
MVTALNKYTIALIPTVQKAKSQGRPSWTPASPKCMKMLCGLRNRASGSDQGVIFGTEGAERMLPGTCCRDQSIENLFVFFCFSKILWHHTAAAKRPADRSIHEIHRHRKKDKQTHDAVLRD